MKTDTKPDTRPLLVFRTERGHVYIPAGHFEEHAEHVSIARGTLGGIIHTNVLPAERGHTLIGTFTGWEGVSS